MSLQPSFPQGAPTLAEVLLLRTFAKPPTPFVDGDLTKALASSPVVSPAATVAIQASRPSGSSTPDPQSGSDAGAATSDASTPSSDGDDPGRNVDVRV
jgi:hypothetical protein